MNLANKLFKDNKTGKVLKVIDSFDTIAILENKDKIDVRLLTNPSLYTEQIDPSSFFNNQNSYNFLAEKIKSINTENIKEDPSERSVSVSGDDISSKFGSSILPATNESAIIMTTEDDEKAELAKKYNVKPTVDMDAVNRQNQALAKFMAEEDQPQTQQIPFNQKVNDDQPVQKIEVKRDDNGEVSESIILNESQIQNPIINNQLSKQTHVIDQNSQVDPIISMFKGVKRGLDFKMNLEIVNKIPRVDFIEMMEDSYDKSIIDFLAEEFTNNLLNDPQSVKKMISDRIKQIVYGGEIKKESKVERVKVEKSVRVKVEKPVKVKKVSVKSKSKIDQIKKAIPSPPTKTLSGEEDEKKNPTTTKLSQ